MLFLSCFSHPYAPHLCFQLRPSLLSMPSMNSIMSFPLMTPRLNPQGASTGARGVLKAQCWASLHPLRYRGYFSEPCDCDPSRKQLCGHRPSFCRLSQCPSHSPVPNPPRHTLDNLLMQGGPRAVCLAGSSDVLANILIMLVERV